MIYDLTGLKEPMFPDPKVATPEADGRLCVGGEITVDWLLLAYSHGIFPWYAYKRIDCVFWYCPKQRFVIFPDRVHVSHSMRTLLNSGKYRVTFNTDFEAVITHCATAQDRHLHHSSWLGPHIIKAYTELHNRGFAQSVEVWNADGKLAGGLYGVTLYDCFFGESMFSLEPNTSKLALISLARRMSATGGKMIDCQFETPHLRSMGACVISYDEYMEIVNPTQEGGLISEVLTDDDVKEALDNPLLE